MSDASDSGTECELHVHADLGLWIPPDFRREDAHVVLRTPGITVQHWGPFGGYYAPIGARHFGSPEEVGEPANPDLCPDRVRIKHAGEDPTEFRVDTAAKERGAA